MVHRTRAPRTGALMGRLPDVDDARRRVKPLAGPAVLTADDPERERGCHERGCFGLLPLPDLRAVEAADLPLDRNRAAIPRRELAHVRRTTLRQRDAHAVRVDQRKDLVPEAALAGGGDDAIFLEAGLPTSESAGRIMQWPL